MEQIGFYTQFVNDPNALANGYTLIKQYLLASPYNRSVTLHNLLHPTLPIITLVSRVYPCEIFPNLSSQQKNQTRLYLSQLIFKALREGGPNSKASRNILNMIEIIHKQQGYQQWIQLYQKIIQNLQNHMLLEFFVKILRNADDRIYPLAQKIYQFVLINFNNEDMKFYSQSQLLLEVLYYSVKSFVHLLGTEQSEENDDQNITLLGGQTTTKALLDFAWSKVTSTLKDTKYSLKLLTVLYGGMMLPIDKNLAFGIIEYGYHLINSFLMTGEQTEEYVGINLDDEDDDEQVDMISSITVIIHQFLQLTQTLIQSSQQFSKNIKIPELLHLVVLGTLSSKAQFDYWIKNSDQYVLSVQDESQKTLRNRCSDFINNLLDKYNPYHKKTRQILRNIYQLLFQAINNNATNNLFALYREFVYQQTSRQISISASQNQRIQEAFYFILMSTYTQIFSEEEKAQLVFTLGARIVAAPNTLIKIACTQICVLQINPMQAQFSLQFLTEISNNNQNSIGLILSIGKGIAKCAISNKISITQELSVFVIQPLIAYLTANCSFSESQSGLEVASYVPLELLLKLLESYPENKEILSHQLTSNLQLIIIQRYMHDGMVTAIIIQLIYRLQNPEIIRFFLQKLFLGHIQNQRLSSVISKWISSGTITLSVPEITRLLQIYQGGNQFIIKNVVSSWLTMKVQQPNFKAELTEQFINSINKNPDNSWLIYMLSGQILNNGEEMLVKTIKQATDETSFPSQFQNKLTLPFFIGLNYTEKFINLVSNVPYQNTSLYEKFLTKFFQYAEYFKGEHLKIIAALFLVKLSQQDKRIIAKSIQIIDKFGKLEVDQWEDEVEQVVDEDQLMDRLIGATIVNDELEKQLQEVFKELAWASTLVQQKLAALKAYNN